jgi:hypothetical protein
MRGRLYRNAKEVSNMRLKIISDGTPTNTQVVNAETGEILEGVVNIKWSVQHHHEGGSAYHDVRCWLEIENTPVEVEAGQLKTYQLRTCDSA